MKASRLLLLGFLVAALPGCAEEPSITPSAPASGAGTTTSDDTREGALVIQPTLELIGMSDVYDRLVVTSLQFDADDKGTPSRPAEGPAPGNKNLHLGRKFYMT